ncbi:hypothetical protein BU24DRAFT_418516 [Aaosphaeria arxii CBS 175.79]|uniref:Uncharacterized protein n=1 Tax=Aaosphaeria arxii CBS 175.79 TaxID=1450172 RepID=A0A6A5Y207_9PLEO|nr:uncharacterized protein BU24DRAFT_418516 [Aaosphaeria arxii CBS 175.79]KAF2018941.1 hypothetical protein BU24DRAFT_418516 [Aaosphaeria arxii CBS 175.79]
MRLASQQVSRKQWLVSPDSAVQARHGALFLNLAVCLLTNIANPWDQGWQSYFSSAFDRMIAEEANIRLVGYLADQSYG